jgi:hypothetical protein
MGEDGQTKDGSHQIQGFSQTEAAPSPAPSIQEVAEEKPEAPGPELVSAVPETPAFAASILDEDPFDLPPPREKSSQELLDEFPERPPLPPNLGALLAAKEAEEAQEEEPANIPAPSPVPVTVEPGEIVEPAPPPASPPRPREGENSPSQKDLSPRISQIRHRYPTPEDQRGERWVSIDQESWLDSTISVGLVLLGAIAALGGLFWWSIFQA